MAQRPVEKGVQIFKQIREAIDGNAEDATEQFKNKLDKLTLSPQTVASEVEFFQEITVPPNSLVLGKDGSKLSSSGQALQFGSAFKVNQYFPFFEVKETGNELPKYYKPADEINVDVNPDSGVVLSDPQEMAFATSAANTFTVAFIVIPATSGKLMIQSWVGGDDTGAVLVENEFIVLPGDIGTELQLNIPNPIMLFIGDSIFTRFSGIRLEGAVQSSGPFTGELKPFLKSCINILTPLDLLVEGADVDVVKIFGSSSVATEQVPLGLDIPLQIEFGPAINDLNDDAMMDSNGTVTINVSGTYQIAAVGHLGRDGTPGEAHLRFSKFISGIQEGPTIGYAIDSSKFITEAVDDSIHYYDEGDTIKYFIARDSSGVDAGGMFLQDVNIPGWNASATAIISVRRVTIIQK